MRIVVVRSIRSSDSPIMVRDFCLVITIDVGNRKYQPQLRERCHAELRLASSENRRCLGLAARIMRPGEPLRGAAAAAGHGGGAVTAAGDAISGGDRQHGGGE